MAEIQVDSFIMLKVSVKLSNSDADHDPTFTADPSTILARIASVSMIVVMYLGVCLA